MKPNSLEYIFPKLNQQTIKLSALGVSSRVFYNWKEKGVIDYEHNYTVDDLKNKVNRKAILLNAFDALWILIVIEFRALNINLDSLIELKNFLFGPMEFHLGDETLESFNDESLKELIPEDVIKNFNITAEDFLKQIKSYKPNSNIYYSNISSLINSIIMYGHNPSLMIHKLPFENQLNFYIFNPHAELYYYKTINQNFNEAFLNNFNQFSIISIPILPLISRFFVVEALMPYTIALGLYTENELKLLSILKNKAFDKITVYNDRGKKDVSFEVSLSENVSGEKAKQLRKIIGLKAYEKIETIYRNEKTIFINKTTKYRPKQP